MEIQVLIRITLFSIFLLSQTFLGKRKEYQHWGTLDPWFQDLLKASIIKKHYGISQAQ